MAEKKKKVETELPEKEEEVLSETEVWDVVHFARALVSGAYMPTYLTPDLVSSKMKDINLNPMAATQTELDRALRAPKSNEKPLRDFSQDFEVTSMIYKRLLAYLANMLSFDITYTTSADNAEYSESKYKKDLEIIERFLDNFEFKKEFRMVIKEMLRNDAYFGVFVDAGNKYILQELPADYCKITGRWENGFLFSFDMYWFMQPGVDINMYPDFFKRKFREIFKDSNGKDYQPSLSPILRERSSWVQWVDIPVDMGVVFKLSPELATRIPYFTPLFNDLILQGVTRNLQKNANMAAASKIIMGEVPMLNRDTKATIKDSIAVSPDLLGKFMALVKNAISDSIRVASAPLNDIKGISFDSENDIYDSYLRTTLASSGINTNLIFTSDVKPNTIETQLSLNVDEQMMSALYDQFNDFMNYFANKETKWFKFRFVFEGTEFFTNRQDRLDKAMALFREGIVLPQKIAAAVGMKPHELRRHMEEASANNFMDKLTMPTVEQQRRILKITQELAPEQPSSTNVDSGSSDNKEDNQPKKRGRPRKKDSEISEEGQATRDQGSNIGRGGKIR